jgi:C-terminal processing protease CtpA/Prc
MKKIYFSLLISLSFAFYSCAPLTPEDGSPAANKLVNQFVYDAMSNYYLWADGVNSKQPNSNKPQDYFQTLLSSTDKAQGWSFITDDAQSLVAEFSGTPKEFGFVIAFGKINGKSNEYFALIEYVYPNSPAANAGLKRLDMLTAIDGKPITQENYEKFYGNETITITRYKAIPSTSGFSGSYEDIQITPATIETNPVLYTNVYEIGGKKIGYLFYTSFISNYNNDLYSVFANFKQNGVSDVIIDLRYNHGGSVTAAVYLASLLAPRNVVESKTNYVIMNYNSYLNNYFDAEKISRTYKLGEYGSKEKNPIDANLNLQKVYIIATSDSYSASELTIHCLRPFMDVIHVGDSTGGKYTASWTIHAYDENYGMPFYKAETLTKSNKNLLYKWAIQPIVAIYADKNKQDFLADGCLIPNNEITEGNGYVEGWREIGDTDDTLLGEALYLISGDENYKPAKPQAVKGKNMQRAKTELFNLDNPKDTKKRAVWIDK